MKRDEEIKKKCEKIVTDLMTTYICELEMRNRREISAYKEQMHRSMQKMFSEALVAIKHKGDVL